VSPRTVDALLAAHALPESENIRSVPLGRTDALSNHLVQIRGQESPHVHAAHDLVVTLLRGNGELHVGQLVVPMHAGDTATIIRGERHFFVNHGPEPAAAFVTFAPPYAGDDNLPVD
jgi:quercetin dioxygenase-like cupin family protein